MLPVVVSVIFSCDSALLFGMCWCCLFWFGLMYCSVRSFVSVCEYVVFVGKVCLLYVFVRHTSR